MRERILVAILGATLLAVSVLASSAQAACIAGGTCSLLGNARFEVGHVPLPVTTLPAPSGRVVATSMATVMQGAVAPRSLQIGAGALTAPAIPVTLPAYVVNTNLLQVYTAHSVVHPVGAAVLAASGRTGPPVASWCPGFAPPAVGFNPGCADATLGTNIKGRLRYSRTANQFGGSAYPAIGGSRNIAFRLAGTPPCTGALGTCVAGIAIESMPNVLALGGGFGLNNAMVAPVNPNGVVDVTVSSLGLILATAGVQGPASGISRSSWGGPWTTGSLTVSVYTPFLGHSIVMLQGTDLRSPGGSGVISLVAGSVTRRSLSGVFTTDVFDVGYMTLMVPEPEAALGAMTALVVLALSHIAMRRRSADRAGH